MWFGNVASSDHGQGQSFVSLVYHAIQMGSEHARCAPQGAQFTQMRVACGARRPGPLPQCALMRKFLKKPDRLACHESCGAPIEIGLIIYLKGFTKIN